MNYQQFAQSLLQKAKITINGKKPYDIVVKNNKLYERVLKQGSLGLGESYIDGWWECKALDEFFNRILRVNLEQSVHSWRMFLWGLRWVFINFGSKSRAFNIGKAHYDIGNDLYEKMLDKRMVYSCGYWKNAKNLEEAQEAKLDLICKKLRLQKGMKVLDIGCGWAGFAKFAAEKYGVEVTGITVSKEQEKFSKKLCADLPVKIFLQDYRDIRKEKKFDRIVSIGMFEHVGYKNYRVFMRIVSELLKDNGLFLLHTIGKNKSTLSADPWVDKYIFPNSILPSIKQIGASIEKIFIMEDWSNIGADYDKTLMAWYNNFIKNWDKIKDNYDKRFYRMWSYYLLSSAGSFRARKNQVWQIIFSKKGILGGY